MFNAGPSSSKQRSTSKPKESKDHGNAVHKKTHNSHISPKKKIMSLHKLLKTSTSSKELKKKSSGHHPTHSGHDIGSGVGVSNTKRKKSLGKVG